MENKNSQNTTKDLGTLISFCNGILEKAHSIVQHLDTQTNILIGISSGIFLFSFSRIQHPLALSPYLLLSAFSGVAAIVGLIAVHPPRPMRKRGQQESLLYNRTILSFPSFESYARELERLAGDNDAVLKQYAIEIYNISKYYYRPKRQIFKIARNMLLTGIALSVLMFLVQTITTLYPLS